MRNLRAQAEGGVIRVGSSPERWVYLQKLMKVAPLPTFWRECGDSVRIIVNGTASTVSISTLSQHPVIVTAEWLELGRYNVDIKEAIEPESKAIATVSLPVLTGHDLSLLSTFTAEELAADRYPRSARLVNGEVLVVEWMKADTAPEHVGLLPGRYRGKSMAVPIDNAPQMGFKFSPFKADSDSNVLFNSTHPFVSWLLRAREACNERINGLSPETFSQLMDLTIEPIGYGFDKDVQALQNYLKNWSALHINLDALTPPDMHRGDFSYRAAFAGWAAENSVRSKT